MAISGSLKDVKFIEILKIVGKRTGRLWIYNFDTGIYQEWFVNQNEIIALRVNRVSQLSPNEVHRAAVALNSNATSQYIFYARELERLPSEISLLIADVAVNLLNENLDLEQFRDQLPNPETRFAASPENASKLSGDLRDFFAKCVTNLAPEFTAGEAATIFQVDLAQTQFNFYKLRAAGVIKPVRISSFVNVANANDAKDAKSFDDKDYQNSIAENSNSSSTAQQIDETKSNEITVAPERKSLVQRMLNALSFNKK